jgi:hypothetical protein
VLLTFSYLIVGRVLGVVLWVLTKCGCCSAKDAGKTLAASRQFNPPLTEHFLKVIRDPSSKKGAPIRDPKKAAASLTANERSRGWQVRHDKAGAGHDGSGLYYKCRAWRKAGTSHGRHHDVGQLYYTYETMDENGIPSYSIADNPDYKVAISAQMAAANSARAMQKALGKVKLGARLKGGAFMSALGGAAAAKKKDHMAHKYTVAKSYADTGGDAGPQPDVF